jgi:peptidoglycan hydrolase-like protein with peptidoglycan-binding domain
MGERESSSTEELAARQRSPSNSSLPVGPDAVAELGPQLAGTTTLADTGKAAVLPAAQILQFQRLVGNGAVARLLAPERASTSRAYAHPATRDLLPTRTNQGLPGIQRYSEDDVKGRAYEIWQKKGSPEGQSKEEQDADYATARRELHKAENPIIAPAPVAGTSIHPVLQRGQPADPAALEELQQKLGSVLGPEAVESMKADADEDVKTRAHSIWEGKGSPADQTKEQQDADYEGGRRQLDEDVTKRAYSIWEGKGSPAGQTKEQQDTDHSQARQEIRAEAGLGAATEKAIKEFQKRNGLPESGIADAATWDLLDASGKSSVGRVEREWEQTLQGTDYGMTSKFSYKIDDKRILVSVGINFVPSATDPPPDLGAVVKKWKTRILGRWNLFKAVKEGTSDSRDIDFESVPTGGNSVEVIDAPYPSDAAHWSVPDNENDNGPAHEFGHLIGLADEYLQTHDEYERLHPDASQDEIDAADSPGGYGDPGDYTNETSMMGLGALSPHDDRTADPEPRHVREFAGYVENYVGGEWKVVHR